MQERKVGQDLSLGHSVISVDFFFFKLNGFKYFIP